MLRGSKNLELRNRPGLRGGAGRVPWTEGVDTMTTRGLGGCLKAALR